MYSYEFTSRSLRQIRKLPRSVQERIIKKLDFYIVQEDPLQFADFLIDSRLGQFRFRIGNYRVVFDLEDEVLVIHVIGHRREIYKK